MGTFKLIDMAEFWLPKIKSTYKHNSSLDGMHQNMAYKNLV